MANLKSFFATILICISIASYIQDPIVIDSVYKLDYMKKSTSFASFTYGVDALVLSSAKTSFNGSTANIGSTIMPRLTIGGLHFWNHADFYVTFPLGFQLSPKEDFAKKIKIIESVECGARIYPWAVRHNKIAPYVGISFQPLEYKYTLNDNNTKYGGATHERFITPIQFGATYAMKNSLLTAGARYNLKPNFEYHTTTTETVASSVSRMNFQFSFIKYMDSSKSAGTVEGVDQLNKKHYILKKHNQLSSWYYAFGPSTALQMSKSPYMAKFHPYLHTDMTNSFIFPEIAFGRYFYKGEFNVNMTARWMTWTQKAFDTKIKMQNLSTGVEAYKFLFDYRGFVPFIGPSFNLNALSIDDNEIKTKQTKLSAGIVFGWDIRISHTGSSLLRTNLRYSPTLRLEANGENVKFNHLEFNFIQFVKFIGRDKVFSPYRTKNLS